MSVYQKMYLELFHAITEALQQISQHNYGLAEHILIKAQQEAEEHYMEGYRYAPSTTLSGVIQEGGQQHSLPLGGRWIFAEGKKTEGEIFFLFSELFLSPSQLR